MKYLSIIIGLIISQNIFSQNILGIDVSHHQGDINWTMVANDGKVFAYCKASEGKTYHDPEFNTYMNGGNAAGIIMGAYHFARPDNNTALQDANNFISQAKNYIGEGFLPPVLDLEDPNTSTHLDQLFTASQLTNWVKNWLESVETQTGVRPIIYTNSNYANYLNSSLNTYGLWIAKPGTSPSTPPSNLGHWSNWIFKQYSWYGSVNGISGNVDLNVFNGTVDDFNSLVKTKQIKKQVRIYPNPVKNILHIENLSENKIKQLEILDINGRLIQQVDFHNKTNINIDYLKTGFYLLKVNFSNDNSNLVIFIKR